MSKTIALTFSGGFHNSSEITIRVLRAQWIKTETQGMPLEDALSEHQQRKLENHFCGISDCCCGSFRRADMDAAE